MGIAILSFVFFIGMMVGVILYDQNRSKIASLEKEIIALKNIMQSSSVQSKEEENNEVINEKGLEFVFEKPSDSSLKKSKTIDRLERGFGVKLSVWLGGIAFAFAGFFLVKYSVEAGLLSPAVRLSTGGVFGIVLLLISCWVQSKSKLTNNLRIAQSLSGSGLAILYGVLFSAASLYHFIPSYVGFVGMTIVTLLAILLSLKQGVPVALLGLFGGFLTPIMVGSHAPSDTYLFSYLYLLFASFMFLVRRQKWWWIAPFVLFGVFIWTLVWMTFYFDSISCLPVELFLIAIGVTIVMSLKGMSQCAKEFPRSFTVASFCLNVIGLVSIFALIGVILAKTHFGLFEWGLFGLLSVGSLALAYFDKEQYAFLPCVSLFISALLFYFWDTANYTLYLSVLMSFSALYMASGSVLMWRKHFPLLWGGLAGASSLLYYLVAYLRLHDVIVFSKISFVWWAIALIMSFISIYTVKQVERKWPEDSVSREHLFSVYSIVAAAFVALSFISGLKSEFLAVAFAIEVFVISWTDSRVSIKMLQPIAMVLFGVFACFVVPKVYVVAIGFSGFYLPELNFFGSAGAKMLQYPLFHFGLPAVLFGGSAFYFGQNQKESFRYVLEITSIILIMSIGYLMTCSFLGVKESILFVSGNFLGRALVTNTVFFGALGCFILNRFFARKSFLWCALVLCFLGAYRTGFFDVLVSNPLWERKRVGEYPILNMLFLIYALPAIWSAFLSKELKCLKRNRSSSSMKVFSFLLFFTFITLSVRQFFRGSILFLGQATNAEIYTYSAAWLLFGIVLLIIGIIKQDKMIRFASLCVMMLTVLKVFLFDVSELQDLYRVFSFFGLGLCLIGLSYFYARFVFRSLEKKEG